MPNAPVNLGVVGTGVLAQRVLSHLVLPDVSEAVRVASVCDPAEGRAEAAAERFGVDRWQTSLDELLALDELDAVTIATPIGLHYEHGLAAIRAGKHVHFNKTMTVTCAQASHLIDEAASAGVHLVASPGEVLRPHVQEIRRMIADGVIGQLCWAACGASFETFHLDEDGRRGSGPLDSVDPSWYFRNPGGGPVYDMTVYALHALTAILGSAVAVTALSGTRITEREWGGRKIEPEAHDNTVMLLDFGESLYAFVYGTAAGFITSGEDWDPGGHYYGTKGSITGLLLNGEPFDYPGRALAQSAPMEGNEWVLPHITEAHRDLIEQHVFEDVMQLVDVVRDGTPTPVTAEAARHVIEIIEAAYRAAETGITQTLTTTVEGLA